MNYLICGRKRVGKDTFFNIAESIYPGVFTRKKLAQPIHDVARVVFGYEITEDNKERVDDRLGIAPREFMQKFGTDWMQALCGRTVWVYKLLEDYCKNMIITDCRFQHEIDEFRIAYGSTVRVVLIRRDTDLIDGHISEKLDIEPDIVIDNNGTMDEYYNNVREVLLENNA